jgi:hypothetical protein
LIVSPATKSRINITEIVVGVVTIVWGWIQIGRPFFMIRTRPGTPVTSHSARSIMSIAYPPASATVNPPVVDEKEMREVRAL